MYKSNLEPSRLDRLCLTAWRRAPKNAAYSMPDLAIRR